MAEAPPGRTSGEGLSTARLLLAAARPRQWTKNLLVAAAPAAAGALAEPGTVGRVAVAFVVFCLASSAAYYVNDVLDAEADRRHPRKRDRPVAAGRLGAGTAVAAGGLAGAGGVALSLVLGRPLFTLAVVVYLAVTIAYSVRLKHIAVADIVVVAVGYILRAVAGGLATDLPLSEWFLIVTSFGALFVVAGKRHAEVARLGGAAAGHRQALDAYTPAFTQHLLSLSGGVTAVAYCLWAFEAHPPDVDGVWLSLSVLPFVTGMLRYALLVFSGQGGEPEEILLRDRPLQAVAVAWAALVAVGIHAG